MKKTVYFLRYDSRSFSDQYEIDTNKASSEENSILSIEDALLAIETNIKQAIENENMSRENKGYWIDRYKGMTIHKQETELVMTIDQIKKAKKVLNSVSVMVEKCM
ncbi:MAG: hypothetical protein JKY96_00125 [Phycisphaerales bacterium]|nr:hypothetical protein [Phycisphaerales bacterium]